MVVAGGGQHLDDAVADLDDGHVERAATQVVHHHLLRRAVVQAVGQRCGRGLVDDAQHVEARDLAGVLRGLALRVVEVGGHGDDGLRHVLAEEGLGITAELPQDHGRQFLRRERFAVDGSAPVAAHAALHGRDGAVGVHGRLPGGNSSHQALAVLRERHHARRGALAFRVGHDGGTPALHRRRAAVRGSQIDAYRRCHASLPFASYTLKPEGHAQAAEGRAAAPDAAAEGHGVDAHAESLGLPLLLVGLPGLLELALGALVV